MRKNLPITNQEFVLHDDQYLISKTDLKGRITYCNPAFVEISGFSRDELLGKPHNIVRHPDMPPEVFDDMWRTLQARKPWLAVVKNRHKSGGYYWVLANAMPVIENEEVTGYASVRVKATEEQIRQADAFYRDIAQDNLRGYRLQAGQRVPAGWRRWLHAAAFPFRRGIVPAYLRYSALTCALAGIPVYFLAQGYLDQGGAARALQIGAAYAAVSLCIVLGAAGLARRFTRQLAGAEEVARQIAAGNLINEVDADARGEVRNLYFYLDIMRKSLTSISTEIIGQTTRHVETIAKLHADSQDLAARTSEQSGALQETAASVTQLASTVARNSESAAAATSLTQESQAVAARGSDIAGQLVETMRGIDESARRIADIVSVIEGIAFQTNILALNAAVEAARAGDQGKGFAVVAGEVRSLAQRTTQAAKEIKQLIDESVARMSAGSSQANLTGDTMQEILQSVNRVTHLMGEIVAASGEQSSGVSAISSAVTRMETVARMNSALVDELSGVAEHLGGESAAMSDVIGVFRTPAARRVAATPLACAQPSPGGAAVPVPYRARPRVGTTLLEANSAAG